MLTFSFLSFAQLYSSPDRGDLPLTNAYIKRCEKDIPHLKSINDEGIEAYRKFVKQIKYKKWARGKALRKANKTRNPEAETKKAKEFLAQKYNITV